jgi:hypothetical protein
LVRYVGLNADPRLHLVLEGVKTFSKFLDITENLSAWMIFKTSRVSFLPFAGTALHGHATELADSTEPAAIRACFETSF